MSVESVTAVRERIEAICKLIPSGAGYLNVIDAACDCDDTFAVPAVEVRVGAGTRQKDAPRATSFSSRVYELWFYGAEVADTGSVEQLRTAFTACETWLDTIPDFFKSRPRLELNDVSLVYRTDAMDDSGIGLVAFCERQFAGIRFTLNVHSARGR